jgi:hypothetical protein
MHEHPEKDNIIDVVVRALINRHKCFLTHARAVLPVDLSSLSPSKFNQLE